MSLLKTFAAGLAAASFVAGAAHAEIVAPEGTQFQLRMEDTVSSRTAREGDKFTVTLAQDVELPDGTILPAGLRGRGKVVDARGNGFLGQTGKLRLRLDYLKAGDTYIPLRGVKAKRGDHRTGAQVVTALIFWPVTPLIRGESTAVRRGAILTAYADADVVLPPLAEAPAGATLAWNTAAPADASAAAQARADAEADAGRW